METRALREILVWSNQDKTLFDRENRLLTFLRKLGRPPDWSGIGKAECFLSRNMEWRKEWKSLRLHRYWLKAPFECLLSRTDGYFAFLFCVVSLCNHLTFYVCYHDVPYLGKCSNASFKFFSILCSNGYRSFCAASQFARSVSANISTYVKINRERRSIVYENHNFSRKENEPRRR